ncbi:MAG: hypothetical protein ABIR47_15955 [Candidatus Kapaibacterium sp.]
MAKRTTTQPAAAKKTVKTGETAPKAATKTARGAKAIDKPRCGLCGNTKNLTKTICCNQWICDDEANYVTFSFARNSCHRNHDRYTLCSFHYNEEHKGKWQDCAACRKDFETEIYVWYGTNEYNFEKLENPPSFEPTKCSSCGTVINLGEDGYSMLGDAYTCEACSARKFREM